MVDTRVVAAVVGAVIGDAGVHCLPNGRPWKTVINPDLPIEVVETIGVKDEPIDATGVPHSDKVVIQERYHRVDGQTLSVEVLVKDELALSKPIRTVVTYKAIADPRWELQELTCTPKTGYHPELFVK